MSLLVRGRRKEETPTHTQGTEGGSPQRERTVGGRVDNSRESGQRQRGQTVAHRCEESCCCREGPGSWGPHSGRGTAEARGQAVWRREQHPHTALLWPGPAHSLTLASPGGGVWRRASRCLLTIAGGSPEVGPLHFEHFCQVVRGVPGGAGPRVL